MVKWHEGKNGASGFRDFEARYFNKSTCRGLFGNLKCGEITINEDQVVTVTHGSQQPQKIRADNGGNIFQHSMQCFLVNLSLSKNRSKTAEEMGPARASEPAPYLSPPKILEPSLVCDKQSK